MVMVNGRAVELFWVVMFYYSMVMMFVNVQSSDTVTITLIKTAIAKGAGTLHSPPYKFYYLCQKLVLVFFLTP